MTCLACGIEIPEARRQAIPLAEFCVNCQVVREICADDLGPDVLAESPIDLSETWGR